MSKQIVYPALLLTLLIITAQISIPIGPVPISLQTFAVMMIATLTSPRQAGQIMTLYLVMGLVGLPVFAGATGGFHSLLSPSFGFIIGFIPTSMMISYLYHQGRVSLWIILLLGNLILYGIGLSYMAWVLTGINQVDLSLVKLLQLGFLPFIPGDILKIILVKLMAERVGHLIRI